MLTFILAAVSSLPPWSTKLSSTLNPEYSWVIISSNRWPGAHAYAIEKELENIYVGWGHKFAVEPYSPPQPPAPSEEYPTGMMQQCTHCVWAVGHMLCR